MSRGPGRIERAIVAAFTAEPENAFTVEDLCDRIFGPQEQQVPTFKWENGRCKRITITISHPEKKHRVAVLRAAKTLMKRGTIPGLTAMPSELLGRTQIYFDHANVKSYAMATLNARLLLQLSQL
jgi:hypothetical protein